MTSYHMSPEEFRANGHALIDWIARYMENVEQYPVMSTVEPGTIREKLPDTAPEQPEAFSTAGRSGQCRDSGCDTLAVTELVCLFPCELFSTRNPW